MWLKAEPSPTSTTVRPEDEDYEAIRERFYAEGWDEGRKRQSRREPDRTAFRTWYGEEIPSDAKDDEGKAKDNKARAKAEAKAQTKAEPEQAQARPEPAKAARPKPQPSAEQAKPEQTEVEQTEVEPPPSPPPPKPAAQEAAPQRLVTAEHAIVPPPTHHAAATEQREAPRPQPQERTAPQWERHTPQDHREVLAPDLGTKGESTVSDTQDKSVAEVATENEPLIRIAMPADHVALLTLNMPKIRNALTAEMRLALRGALKNLAANDRVHALVITGADGNFCAGGDVRTMGETDPHKIRQRMTEVAETAEAVASFPKPVIAAVAGHAAGAGVSLACLADVIVVDESTQFTFSFLRLALGPDWGLTWSLPRRVGATKARGLILSRDVVDAREAQQIGLADHYASEGETQIAAIELAKKMCNGPREATAAVKTMLSDLDGLRAALAAEMNMQLDRFPSWEHQEGATAFKEKRAADYSR